MKACRFRFLFRIAIMESLLLLNCGTRHIFVSIGTRHLSYGFSHAISLPFQFSHSVCARQNNILKLSTRFASGGLVLPMVMFFDIVLMA